MSRIGHFTQGASPSETPSLQARAQTFNNQNPHGFQANGLNQPLMRSAGNGNSETDARRQTPNGQLPDANGDSQSTYNKINPSYQTHTGV